DLSPSQESFPHTANCSGSSQQNNPVCQYPVPGVLQCHQGVMKKFDYIMYICTQISGVHRLEKTGIYQPNKDS
ncbi:MAG TPA: hypothetical protein PLX62_11350, partial [Bacteroidales bacterium]|nr:hypothetical protein [Bacteroidales bacterium]